MLSNSIWNVSFYFFFFLRKHLYLWIYIFSILTNIQIYLPDKPPIEDLQYFLDFQIARAWAPEQSNLQRKEPVCESLQFSLMGPKLFVSADQVNTEQNILSVWFIVRFRLGH